MTEPPPEVMEVICCRPGIWPNWRSSGAVTDGAMTSGLGAGVEGLDLNDRVVDLRKRGDRQLHVGDEARKQDGHHQQRGGHRAQNERP